MARDLIAHFPRGVDLAGIAGLAEQYIPQVIHDLAGKLARIGLRWISLSSMGTRMGGGHRVGGKLKTALFR